MEQNRFGITRHVPLIADVEFIHGIVRDDCGQLRHGVLIRSLGLNRVTRHGIARLQRIHRREIGIDGVGFIDVAARKRVLAVDHVIDVADALVVFERGGILETVAAERSSGRAVRKIARSWNEIAAAGQLELKNTDGDGIDVIQPHGVTSGPAGCRILNHSGALCRCESRRAHVRRQVLSQKLPQQRRTMRSM